MYNLAFLFLRTACSCSRWSLPPYPPSAPPPLPIPSDGWYTFLFCFLLLGSVLRNYYQFPLASAYWFQVKLPVYLSRLWYCWIPVSVVFKLRLCDGRKMSQRNPFSVALLLFSCVQCWTLINLWPREWNVVVQQHWKRMAARHQRALRLNPPPCRIILTEFDYYFNSWAVPGYIGGAYGQDLGVFDSCREIMKTSPRLQRFGS